MRCNCSAGLLIRCYQACFCEVVTYKFLFSIAVGQTFSLHWLLFILAEFMCSPSRILERSTCGFTPWIEGGLALPWELCAVSLQSIQKGGHLGTSACLCSGIRCKYKLKYNLKYNFFSIKIWLENTNQLKSSVVKNRRFALHELCILRVLGSKEGVRRKKVKR